MENTNRETPEELDNTNYKLEFKSKLFTKKFINDYKEIDSKFDMKSFKEYLTLDDNQSNILKYHTYYDLLNTLINEIFWDLDPVTKKEMTLEDKIQIIQKNILNLYTSVSDLYVPVNDNMYKVRLLKEAAKNNPMLNKLVISFEGVDATGKQTISNLVKNFLMFMDSNNAPVNPEILKINIPNYNIQSGIKIKDMLEQGNYNPKVLQDLFALNRKEVQNTILEFDQSCSGQIVFGWEPEQELIQSNKITIFDRWTDSAAAFKIAKEIKSIIDCELHQYKDIIRNLTLDDIEELILTRESLFNLLEEQFNFEHNTLGLVRPDIKILCTAPIEILKERLESRAKALEIELDSHEKDMDYLHIVQLVYKFIFNKTQKISKNYKGLCEIINTHNLSIPQSVIWILKLLISPNGTYQTLINNNALIDYKLLQAGILDPLDFSKNYTKSKYKNYWVDKSGCAIHDSAMKVYYPERIEISPPKYYGCSSSSEINKKYLAIKTLKEKNFQNFKTLLD